MTRFEEVTRLRELEKKATPAPWYYGVHPDNCDECEDCDPEDGRMCDNPIKPDFGPVAMISSGDVVPGIFASVVFDTEDNPNGQTITCFRNAAPWLLEVVGCFQPGDAALMGEILALHREFEKDYPDENPGWSDLFARMEKAAKILEGQE